MWKAALSESGAAKSDVIPVAAEIEPETVPVERPQSTANDARLAELAELVAAWPALSAGVRAGIMAMVRELGAR